MPDNGRSDKRSDGSDYSDLEDNYWGYDNNGNYRKTYDGDVEEVDEDCAEKFRKEGWTGVQEYLKEALENGIITESVYVSLFNKYRDM